MRLFPPITNSFFIFNANEDNRLCLDSVYKAPDFEDYRWEKRRKTSVIPVRTNILINKFRLCLLLIRRGIKLTDYKLVFSKKSHNIMQYAIGTYLF